MTRKYLKYIVIRMWVSRVEVIASPSDRELQITLEAARRAAASTAAAAAGMLIDARSNPVAALKETLGSIKRGLSMNSEHHPWVGDTNYHAKKKVRRFYTYVFVSTNVFTYLLCK